MKKILSWFLVIIICCASFYLAYNYKNNQNPKIYYKVYLNDEVLGVIESEKKLNKFIDKESETIKNKYNVSKVYLPEGLYIEPLSSYDAKLTSIDDVVSYINENATLRIDGYQISVKNDDNQVHFYITDEDILTEAITELIKTFVGTDNYQKYLDKTQSEIVNTGSIIENVYVQNEITVKKVKVPVDQKIYQTTEELTRFLLFGENYNVKKYKIVLGDTIAKVAYNNQISTEEFLLSNTQYNDKNNLLHIGDEVNIIVTNPQLKVVYETYEVADMVSAFVTEEIFDDDKYIGEDTLVQEGKDGLIRVTQSVQRVNGSIAYINPIDKTELKPTVNKIIIKGNKEIPYVGDLNNWAWPSLPGYTLSDDFEWRINPVTGEREHHSGIDIAGTGYGSPVYAANNGIIEVREYSSSYGYYIVINHNNGYWTLYAHMSRFDPAFGVGDTVMRGQTIGYVGSTGWSTGPHLHFELWLDCKYCRINPLDPYR